MEKANKEGESEQPKSSTKARPPSAPKKQTSKDTKPSQEEVEDDDDDEYDELNVGKIEGFVQ